MQAMRGDDAISSTSGPPSNTANEKITMMVDIHLSSI